MALKLKLPPGFYKNGTAYQAVGRWFDGNLVRWQNNILKPINGWQRRFDFVTDDELAPITGADEVVRSGIALVDLTAGVDTYLGTNKKIQKVSRTNVVTDVTPVGFTPQGQHAALPTGYGRFRYSFGQYGTPRPAPSDDVPHVFSWGFAGWGFWPVAVARAIGGMKVQWKKDVDAIFIDLPNSPSGTFDVIVTDERIVMTIGKTTEFRRIEWSDQEQPTVWTPAVDNQAGGITLAGTGRLLRGIKIINHILVLGENDAFAGRYVGPPYVYGFDRIGSRCGVVGPEAVAVTEAFAMWLSDLSFWRYDGTLTEIPCEVMDFYQKDHNRTQRSKTCAFTISDYSEIWWIYQSVDSPTNEVDSYVIYNWQHNKWYTGRIDRTFGLDNPPLAYPLMVSSGGLLYDHEIQSAGRDGLIPFITSGPLEVENGKRALGFSHVLPDDELRGDMEIELEVRDNAQDKSPRYAAVFPLTDPTPTTGIMGRDIRMTVMGTLNDPNWVVGDFRIEPLAGATPRR